MKWLASILITLSLISPFAVYAVPSIQDTLNLTYRNAPSGSSTNSFSYTVPAGSNQVLIVFATGGGTLSQLALNGVTVTTTLSADGQVVDNNGGAPGARCDGGFAEGANRFAWIKNPTSGTLTVTYDSILMGYVVMTLNDANVSGSNNPIDAYWCKGQNSGTSFNVSVSTTTPSASDLLLDWAVTGSNEVVLTHGSGQTEFMNFNNSANNFSMTGTYVTGSSTVNTVQTMSELWQSQAANYNSQMIAISPSASAAGALYIRPQPVINF